MKNNCISPRPFSFVISMLAVFSFGITKSVAQEWDHEYVPFVEEGKIWYCSFCHTCDINPPKPTPIIDEGGMGIDIIFTMQGDTLIGEHTYKKVYWQNEEYYGDKEQHYYCAVREESYQVLIIDSETTDEKLLYDFSYPKETITIEYGNHKFARAGGCRLKYYVSAPINQYEYDIYEYGEDGEIDIYYCLGTWKEGIGLILGNPFGLEVYGDKRRLLEVITCMKDGQPLYKWLWRVQPSNIESICHNSSLQTSVTFDLQGRRLTAQPKSGLYIRDGKKYVVK